jgi:hypothetical protein
MNGTPPKTFFSFLFALEPRFSGQMLLPAYFISEPEV